MDAVPALLPPLPFRLNAPSDIPSDIYLHLLHIAKLGYDPNDVRSWYTSITAQLFRVDSANGYPTSTSEPSTTGLLSGLEVMVANDPDVSGLSPGYVDGSGSNASLTTGAFSFQSFATHEMTAASPHSAPSTYETSSPAYGTTSPAYETASNFSFEPTTPWDSQAPRFFVNDPTYADAAPADHSQWLQPTDSEESPRRRRLSQPSSYHLAVAGNAMPLPIPSNDTFQPMHNSLFGPFGASAQYTYLPQITVIPSRKKRKSGRKQVKQFIQPLHVSTQPV